MHLAFSELELQRGKAGLGQLAGAVAAGVAPGRGVVGPLLMSTTEPPTATTIKAARTPGLAILYIRKARSDDWPYYI